MSAGILIGGQQNEIKKGCIRHMDGDFPQTGKRTDRHTLAKTDRQKYTQTEAYIELTTTVVQFMVLPVSPPVF